jgi:hypothetical protein
MPRLIVPSSGGGTNLMRTFLTGATDGDCSGVGEGVAVCSGEIEGEGDCSGVGERVGLGDSCANAKEEMIAIAKARLTLVVMSSEVETSLFV